MTLQQDLFVLMNHCRLEPILLQQQQNNLVALLLAHCEIERMPFRITQPLYR